MIRRIIRFAAVVGLLAPLLAIASAGPVGAQRCSSLDPAGTACNIRVPGGGRPPVGESSVTPTGDQGPSISYSYRPTTIACDAAGGGGWTELTDVESVYFDLGAVPPVDPAEPGFLYIIEIIDPASGATNTGYLTCVGEGDGVPAPPPPPPTADEIWGAALTFTPEVHLDPLVRGLTGLETEMWYEGETDASIDLTLRGYNVTANIQAVEFVWYMDGADRAGRYTYARIDGGSAEEPAATHTYALPGLKAITHEVVWAGTADISGPAFPAGTVTIDLGTATLTVARDYDVIEVRAPVVGGGDQTGTEG